MDKPNWKYAGKSDIFEYFKYKMNEEGAKVLLVGEEVASLHCLQHFSAQAGDSDFEKAPFEDEFIAFKKVMKEMGYALDGFGYYSSDKYFRLKFKLVMPPASFHRGEKHVKASSKEGDCIIIYAPTDCVCDRLFQAITLNAFEYVTQAAKVAKVHPINLKTIQKFCLEKKSQEIFNFFIKKAQLTPPPQD